MNPDKDCVDVRLGGLWWRVRGEAVNPVQSVCADVERAIANASKLYKNSRNITVASIPGSPPLVIRRMNYGRLRHRLKDFLRSSRARRAFERGLRLEQAGLPTPRMLAVAELRRFGWPVSAYLVSDEVPAAQTLAAAVRARAVDLRPLAERLAAVIARLHDSGFVHRDLKPSNVLLDRERNPWLIDMDGLRFVRDPSERQVVRDLRVLATLLVKWPHARRAALRFLVCYCRQRGLTPRIRQLAARISATI